MEPQKKYKIISHRGNIEGPSKLENSPDRINKVIELGFDCEVDVWYDDSKYWLGHDRATYKIDINFLKKRGLWCHAKNLSALQQMLNHNIHCFWHEEDDFTLTSKGYIWTYPGKATGPTSVIVLHGDKIPDTECYGVCSDFVSDIKARLVNL